MNIQKKSSGALFVRYISFGLIAIFSAIAILKFGDYFHGNRTAIALGAIIFSINLFTVLGYVYAVLSDDNLLAESDSPDLAYYLGFSLTVGALSATFIVDTLIGQDATAHAKSDLVKNSLLQFGIGLTATLIGLCGKIYLSSQQNSNQTEPEELIRSFRFQLNDYQRAIQDSTIEFTETLKNSTAQLTESVGKAMSSFEFLNETIVTTNNNIIGNLGSDKFHQAINDFSKSVNEFLSVTNKFIDANAKATSSITEVSSRMSALSSAANLVTNQMGQLEKSNQELNTSSKSLNDQTVDLIDTQKIIASQTKKVSSSLDSANESIVKLISSVEDGSKKITSGFGDVSELQNFKISLGRTHDELKRLESLINRISNIKF
jgi:ethanolamine utilization protein EutQ (cupin superfamily)